MLTLISAVSEIHSLFLGHWQRVGRVEGPSVMLSLKDSPEPCLCPCLLGAWDLHLLCKAQVPPLREQGAFACFPGHFPSRGLEESLQRWMLVLLCSFFIY